MVMNTQSTDTTHRDAVARAAIERAVEESEPGFGTFFLARFLDLTITYDDQERTCTVQLPWAEHLCNPQGSMHGGILATALDISMGHLAKRHVSTCVTVEMQQRFMRPLTGDGRCVATLLNAGRTMVHAESRLFDAQDRIAAVATGSWFVLPTPDREELST